MDLNLFESKDNRTTFINKFIEELRNVLENVKNKEQNMNKKNNVIDDYNLYEKRKIFLDNKSRRGNDFAWIMDEESVCISEDGDGGPVSISEIDLPLNTKVGEVYEKIDGKYVYNSDVTAKLKEVTLED